MTERELAEKAESIATRDPNFYRALRRARFLSALAVIGAVLVLLVLAYTLAVNIDQEQRIDSPEALPTCVALRKVGYPCPRPGSGVKLGERGSSEGVVLPGGSSDTFGRPPQRPGQAPVEPAPEQPSGGEPAPQPPPQPQPSRPPTLGEGLGDTVDGLLCTLAGCS